MLRMLRMSGLKTADVLALTTGFMVTLDDPSMDSMTVMRSVESRATDLNRIHAVNQLSRVACHDCSIQQQFIVHNFYPHKSNVTSISNIRNDCSIKKYGLSSKFYAYFSSSLLISCSPITDKIHLHFRCRSILAKRG